MNRDILDKEKIDREIAELVDKGNKRLAVVVIILSILPTPLMFLMQDNLQLFMIGWIIWSIISIRVSSYIVMKIWKN